MIKQLLQNTASLLTVSNQFYTATDDELNVLLERWAKLPDTVVAFVPPVQRSVAKQQGNTIYVDHTFNMLFLKAIPNSSLDGETDSEVYPICESMFVLATQFFNRLQESESYRRGMTTTINWAASDVLEKFDSYLAGQAVNCTVRLWLDYDYCNNVLNGL